MSSVAFFERKMVNIQGEGVGYRMKTFILKSLKIMEVVDKGIVYRSIPLIDGLIINREDEMNQWVVEAYIDHSHLNYFTTLQESGNEIIIQVRITKESNEPAGFITTIIGMNEIDAQMNVLFKGTIIDHGTEEMDKMFKTLVDKQYFGKELISEFKKMIELE